VKGKKPSFDSDFYTKKVLGPLSRNLKKRRGVTNNILTTKLFPDPDDWTLQQDGATCHTSRKTKAYLLKKKIELLSPWPPNSPDMNPIENLWAILTEKVYQVEIHTVTQLRRRVRKCWKEIDPQILKNLVADMPNRIAELKMANGGAISR
jgi:hypothetical protein